MNEDLKVGTLARHAAAGSSEIVLITDMVHGPDGADVTIRDAIGATRLSSSNLRAADDIKADEIPRIKAIVGAELEHRAQQCRADSERARNAEQRAENAEAKVQAMRAYAIAAFARNDICRDGLDEFLEEHDLEPYDPEYAADLTVQLRVAGRGIDASDIWRSVQELLDVS